MQTLRRALTALGLSKMLTMLRLKRFVEDIALKLARPEMTMGNTTK